MTKHHISFKHAIDGILYCFKTQPNFRFHLLAAIVAITLGLYFNISSGEWILLGLTVVLVIFAEMVNTALESMTDLISKEYSQQAKIAKDVSAGMVLVAAIGSLIVGFFIFLPYLQMIF